MNYYDQCNVYYLLYIKNQRITDAISYLECKGHYDSIY